MPKRKRDEEIEDQISQIADQALRIRVSRLKARFEHGVSQLTAQLRLARGFDRQKMTRRIKQAGTDKAKIERLNAEIQYLNNIKEAKVARSYLLKQCARTKRIAESEAFIALFGTDAESKGKAGSVSVAEGNVLGRLFKVEAVSKVLPEIMKGIREVLGVDKPVEAKLNGPGVHGEEKETARVDSISDEEFAGFSDEHDQAPSNNGLDAESKVQNDFSGSDDELSDASDDDLLTAYNDRLAASSDSDSNNELQANLTSNGQNHDRLDDMEVTTDEEDNLSPSDHDLPTPKKAHKPVQPPPSTSTSFLPSLMHGGYYSGSDSASEADDAAFSATQKAERAERKNRRGQKARQAIAEKKFGARAKHLLKAKGAEGVHGDRQRLIQSSGRNEGWDARKGAVSSSERERRIGGRERKEKAPNRFERRNGYAKAKESGSGRRPRPDGPVAERPRSVKTVAKAGEKLHPSWEAARKKKLEIAGAGVGNFAGKKITFD